MSIPDAALAGRRVAIVLPDATRPLPLRAALAPLIERLSRLKARPTMIVGLGLHRPMSVAELAPIAEIAPGLPLLQHDAAARDLVRLSPDVHANRPGPRLPATFHPSVAGAEAIVTLGVVEPHQYAGFSGGTKGIAIGCAGRETIAAMHGAAYLRARSVQVARLDGNPFRAALDRLAATIAAPQFAIQYVPSSGDLVRGPVLDAFAEASRIATRSTLIPHARRAPWVHARPPAAKATNFYQASRALTYVAGVERPIVEPGGAILVSAPCPEGLGLGAGERAFAAMIERGRAALAAEIDADLPPADLPGGAQRAYVLARALTRYRAALIGAPPMPSLAKLGLTQADSLASAIEALELDPGAGIELGDPFTALPYLAP